MTTIIAVNRHSSVVNEALAREGYITRLIKVKKDEFSKAFELIAFEKQIYAGLVCSGGSCLRSMWGVMITKV